MDQFSSGINGLFKWTNTRRMTTSFFRPVFRCLGPKEPNRTINCEGVKLKATEETAYEYLTVSQEESFGSSVSDFPLLLKTPNWTQKLNSFFDKQLVRTLKQWLFKTWVHKCNFPQSNASSMPRMHVLYLRVFCRTRLHWNSSQRRLIFVKFSWGVLDRSSAYHHWRGLCAFCLPRKIDIFSMFSGNACAQQQCLSPDTNGS